MYESSGQLESHLHLHRHSWTVSNAAVTAFRNIFSSWRCFSLTHILRSSVSVQGNTYERLDQMIYVSERERGWEGKAIYCPSIEKRDRTSAFVKSSCKSTRCCPANGKFNCKAIRGDSKLLMFVLPARTTSHCLVVEAASFRCAAHTGPGSAAFPQLSACRQSVLVKTAIYYPRVIMTVAVMAWRVAGQFSSLGCFHLPPMLGWYIVAFEGFIWSCIQKYALFKLLAGHLWMF